jgi:hypothetical protein
MVGLKTLKVTPRVTKTGSPQKGEGVRLWNLWLTAVLSLFLVVAPSGGEERNTLARYIVFEVDPSGAVKPQKHQIVRLVAPRSSLTETQVQARLAESSPDGDRATVRLLSSSRSVLYQDVVEIPRWLRTEIGADGALDSTRNERLVKSPKRSFVVRVPVSPAIRLALSFAPAQDATQGPSPRDVEFDLAALAADESLPLAGFSPVLELRAAEAGTSGNRVDLLIMGDGYTASQSAKFDADANGLLNSFLSIPPYSTYRNFVKTSTLFTASAEPGADHPPYSASCPAGGWPITCCADPFMLTDPLQGRFVNTAFDASYCVANTYRFLAVDTTKVLAAAAAAPDWDRILVLVNDPTYGGSGGQPAVVSTNLSAVEVAQHEYGHSFTRLADEYTTAFTGFGVCSDITGPACEANVTDQTNRSQIKWLAWIQTETPTPTPDSSFYSNAVGLFEGARYLTTGMYRPRLDCIMRALGQPFCQICSQAYILRLYQGGWGIPASGIDNIEPGSEIPAPGPVSMALPGSVTFTVGLLQPAGGPALSVIWLVNGTAVGGANSNSYTFTPSEPGTYRIELRTKDMTPLVSTAMAGTVLEHSRAWTVTATPKTCFADSTNLCLNNGRFKLQAMWATPDGQSGVAQAVPLTADTGDFWFFTSSNIEIVVKVVDGRSFNARFWVFAAGLTNVSVVLTVTDTQTGTVRTYINPQGTAFAPIQDTNAFASATTAGQGANGHADVNAQSRDFPFRAATWKRESARATALCVANASTLCLNNGRFSVRTQWATSDGNSGAGQAVAVTADAGYFWFFSSDNVEVFVKELNACSFNSRFWTFAGGLTNVNVVMTVTDTQTGAVKTYTNPQGTPFAPIQDTNAFAMCP